MVVLLTLALASERINFSKLLTDCCNSSVKLTLKINTFTVKALMVTDDDISTKI